MAPVTLAPEVCGKECTVPTKRKSPASSRKAKPQRAKLTGDARAKLRSYEPSSVSTPSHRLARLLRDAEARGIEPLDEAAIQAMRDVWPEDEEVDEFIAWLR